MKAGERLGLLALIREDWNTHGRSFFNPGFHALALHRLGAWRLAKPRLIRAPVGLIYRAFNTVVVRNVYGTTIYDTSVIGRRFHLVQHVGVIVGAGAVIGDDCLVRQNVILAQAKEGPEAENQPRVGHNVQIGVGAMVLGPITIGDNVRIGPQALVVRDVPAGATVMAAVARVLPAEPVDA